MVRRMLFGIALAVATVGWPSSVAGDPGPAPIDISALDVGNYATTPEKNNGPSTIMVDQLVPIRATAIAQ